MAEAVQFLFSLGVLVIAGKIAGAWAERRGQPAVLGELAVGVVLGASLLGGLLGLPDFAVGQRFDSVDNALEHDPDNPELLETAGLVWRDFGSAWDEATAISALATLGVLLLLFEVGLESDIRQLRRVGPAALLVALIGIVASFAVGYGLSALLTNLWSAWQVASNGLPPYLLHVFVGATLTATSVGITARVLRDLGRLSSDESRIILGAAVLDDIGGLLILAVVTALIAAAQGGAGLDALGLLIILGKAALFVVAALTVGMWVLPRAYDALCRSMPVRGMAEAGGLAIALLLSYAAGILGLAPIVGAFAAGVILARSAEGHTLLDRLRPLAAIVVPLFFVTVGMHVDVVLLAANWVSLALVGSVLAVAAVLAKLACGLGVVGSSADRFIVGVGMVPRGEVGLIFALLGLEAGLIANWQYGILLFVVFVTTFITPFWLGRLQGRFSPTPAPVAAPQPQSGVP